MDREQGEGVAPDGCCEDVRFFNTEGVCTPERHYMLPAGSRLPDAMEYIEQGKYIVLNAPRQTGKTTTLYALERELSTGGEYLALVVSCEQASPAGEDYGAVIDVILGQITEEALALGLPPEHMPPSRWPSAPPESRLRVGLTAWARSCPLPIVLFLDEIDSLQGKSLVSVLRQLRAGYNARSRVSFPASIVLCGMRQIRDYKLAYGGSPEGANPYSPFNIGVPLRMSDFTREQVGELYAQHTAETGQEFTAEAVDRAFGYSQGQPWLVNAIAYEITFTMRIRPPEPVTADHVDTAKERLILARAVHLEALDARLNEPPVQRIIEPMIAGTHHQVGTPEHSSDLAYVRNLGLITESNPIRVANPILKEVIIRVLSDRFAGAFAP